MGRWLDALRKHENGYEANSQNLQNPGLKGFEGFEGSVSAGFDKKLSQKKTHHRAQSGLIILTLKRKHQFRRFCRLRPRAKMKVNGGGLSRFLFGNGSQIAR